MSAIYPGRVEVPFLTSPPPSIKKVGVNLSGRIKRRILCVQRLVRSITIDNLIITFDILYFIYLTLFSVAILNKLFILR